MNLLPDISRRAKAAGLLAAVLLILCCLHAAAADPGTVFTIAQLKYRGGGDWYANPTALPNLLRGRRAHRHRRGRTAGDGRAR